MRKDPRILSEMADEHGGPRHQGDTDGDDDRKELAIEAPAHTPGTGQMLARTDALMSQAETGKIALRPSSPLWPVVTRRGLPTTRWS